MPLICTNSRSTLDEIPLYRKQYIDTRLKSFVEEFSIHHCPIDCVELIKRMRESRKIPLQIGAVSRVSDKFDAVSIYVKEQNVYQIILNKNKVRYPFIDSKDRRLNFTIAHELGHIVLDHLCIPNAYKSEYDRHVEDLEANEFAGKLLMPEKTLLRCNFVSIPAVAKYFNVSNTALWIRLNNLQRLDLLDSRKTKVCNICGNIQFHKAARYCRICGNTLKNNLNGVEKRSYYETVCTDTFLYADCPYCGQTSYKWPDGACPKCNMVLHNYCHKGLYVDKGCCSYTNPENARFCEACGSETYFYSMGFLKGWEEVKTTRP